jgi:hypothetical protein
MPIKTTPTGFADGFLTRRSDPFARLRSGDGQNSRELRPSCASFSIFGEN